MEMVHETDSGFDALWSELLRTHDNPTPLISASYLEYRAAYLGDKLEARYRSVVVDEAGKLVAGSCFDLIEGVLDAVTVPSATVVARNARRRHAAEKLLRGQIAQLFCRYGSKHMRFIDQLVDGGLSNLSLWALQNSATCNIHFTQVLDLTRDPAILWHDVSRSVQRHIKWGRKNMLVRVSQDRTGLEALRRVHFVAAGRTTRPSETWEIQGRMIDAGEAFVTLAELGGEIVSAIFHQRSGDYCYYGVGASDRSRFTNPISHAVLWAGIEHARQIGCRHYTVGSQVWPGHHHHPPANAPKEISIANFKRRFGGRTTPEMLIDLPRPQG